MNLLLQNFWLDSSSLGGVAHPETRVATAPARVEGRAGLVRGACLAGLVRNGSRSGYCPGWTGWAGWNAWMALPEKASKKLVSK